MSVEDAFKIFGDVVTDKAKQNLASKNKNASSNLSNSIKFFFKKSKNSIEFYFDLADYWEYVDRGVKGKGGNKADGSSWKTKNVKNSPFAYTNKKPPTSVFDKWIVRRGFAPRNKGKFTSRESLKFAIANSVYHTGLETTNFITKPFEEEFKNLPDKVVEAYGLEVEKLIKNSIQ